MPTGAPERRLATFLFLDIVGSTSIASDLGDRRWRDLLGRFRRIVRAQLRSYGGKEEDTAGDGHFATFTEPARAIRGAAAIAEAVHELGVEVRCGLHTGEAEVVDGTYAGIGVHIAARVMSLAGPAEIFVTSTMKELVTGAGIEFEDLSTHELKGVPGTWQVFAVRSIDGRAVASPLLAEDAAARIQAIEAPARGGRRVAILVGTVVVGIAVLVTAVLVFTRSDDEAPPSRPQAIVPETTTLVGIDTSTGELFRTLSDDGYSKHLWGILAIEDDFLWQATPATILRRDLETGQILDTIEIDDWRTMTRGFGYIWIATETAGETSIVRVSPLSGESRSITVPGRLADLRAGNGALWYLDLDGVLREIDPLNLKVVAEHDTGTVSPAVVVPVAGFVWVCECDLGRIVQFDPRRDEIVRELELPQHGYMLGVASDTSTGRKVWLLDPEASTLTPIDPVTGEPGRAFGVRGVVTDATIVGSQMWVSTQTAVYRVDLISLRQERFPVPGGVSAGSVAPTPDGSAIWVANCGCPIEE